MIVDFALEAEREHGKSPEEAIFEASLLRFRPILMTTLAAMLGALPMLLGTGTGSELRRPLGLAIIGGLALSQMLTLFTTPVIYLCSTGLRGVSVIAGRTRPRPSSASVNIPALFIDRPVATTLLAVAILLSGALAYFHLPVAPLPNITFPVVVVQANMAGRRARNHGVHRRRAIGKAHIDNRRRDGADVDQLCRRGAGSSSNST